MSLIRKHGAVLQAWACLDLVNKLIARSNVHLKHFAILICKTLLSALKANNDYNVHLGIEALEVLWDLFMISSLQTYRCTSKHLFFENQTIVMKFAKLSD